MRATVLRGTGGIWTVLTEDRVQVDAILRGRVKLEGQTKLAVGDEVELEQEARGTAWAIASIWPRRSQLARRSPGEGYGERVVAANLDQVIVVFAMVSPEPHLRMLDRFLVIAEANDISPRIVVNKVDLVARQVAEDFFAEYVRVGYPVHFTSRVTGEGLVELHEQLAGKNSALTGPSGVGKSSLLNAMYPGLDLRVSAISESVNKGRHTTVGAHAHPLPDGGLVMDTPGLREIGLWGLAASSLDRCFPEFATSLGECRFADCIHVAEPSCAVRDGVRAGRISAARYDSYTKLLEEVRAAERTAS